ncbi:MAG TPA: hypothetical protein VNN10_03705 [Dehalococcoidia bacterium]|nr:hypothetical protein [Dehalococcoidia bacterium]
MNDFARGVVREPGAETARQFVHRVRMLAAIYAVMFVASIAGMVILVQWGRLLVTLSQRSNVETLAILFFLIFFAYFALISGPGALGALRLAYYTALEAARSRAVAEAARIRALGAPGRSHKSVALNVIVEKEGQPGEDFELRIEDEFGSMGCVRVSGARLTHVPAHGAGTTSVFIFFEHQANRLLMEAGVSRRLNIVEWNTINDETLEEYTGLVDFARRLGSHLGLAESWPKVTLTRAQCDEIERRFSEVCRALRNEGLLPEWEYSANHKLPLIPEPLGLLSLDRSEKRVDPLSSMGTAAAIVVGSALIFAFLVLAPPWVPGT